MARDPYDKFTDRAKKALALAQDEASRFQHNYIGTEHLLLGLVAEGEGIAARVLENMNIDLSKIRTSVEFIIGRGDRPVVGEVGLTPRSRRVIELGIDEARRLGHNYIGTEHILLGLVREGEGIAAGVLESCGANLDGVRKEVVNIISYNPTTLTAPNTSLTVAQIRNEHWTQGGIHDKVPLQGPCETCIVLSALDKLQTRIKNAEME